MVMDPVNPRKLFAAMWDFRRQPDFLTSGGPGSGLFVTHDGGDSWHRVTPEDGFPRGELGRIASLVGTIADTEQSIMRHDHIKAWLGLWLWVHIVSSHAAFALMFSHLAIEMYLGFRWL